MNLLLLMMVFCDGVAVTVYFMLHLLFQTARCCCDCLFYASLVVSNSKFQCSIVVMVVIKEFKHLDLLNSKLLVYIVYAIVNKIDYGSRAKNKM